MRASALCTAGLLMVVLSGCPENVKPPPPPPPAPEVKSFTVSPATIAAGQTATVAWDTANATDVKIVQVGAGPVDGASGAKGSVEVTIQEQTLFVLTAQNERGVQVSAAAAVEVEQAASEVVFVASPDGVDSGAPVTIAWSAPGAKTVTLAEKDGASIDLGTQLHAGAVTVKPVASTTYVLTVDGVAHEQNVSVRPVISALVSAPVNATPGEMLTVSWQAAGAGEVALSLNGGEPLHTETDAAKVADGSFAYAVPATLTPSTVLTFTLSAKGTDGALSAHRHLVVYPAVALAIHEWNVPAYAAVGGKFTVDWRTSRADYVEVIQDGTVIHRSATLGDADQGSLELPTPAQDSKLQLRAYSVRGGELLSDEKTVNPVGLPVYNDFTATPDTLANGGEEVILAWDVDEARKVQIVEVGGRSVHVAEGVNVETGSVSVRPNKSVTYELRADNGLGDEITPVTVAVTVGTPATLTFTPSSMPIGAPTQITGSTVTGSGDIIGLPHTTVVKNATGESFVDIKADGIAVGYPTDYTFSSRSVALPVAMPTQVFGQLVPGTHINVNINGWLTFESSEFTASGDNAGATIGTALRPLSVAPYFDDLRSKISGSEIYYRVDGGGLTERLIVQWDNVEHDDYPGSSMTFQAQIYASGKIVFAYKSLTGVDASNVPAIGVVNLDETAEVNSPDAPIEGDTYTFFGAMTPPITIAAQAEPFRAFVLVNNAHVEIETTLPVIPPNQFLISEVNYNPATGKEEWFEVVNLTSTAFDLGGWDIDFGNSSVHTIAGSLILPANGRLIFGQSSDSAELSSGGAAVDYVYGTTFTMPDASGSVSISLGGGVYTSLSWTTAGTQGASLQVGAPQTNVTLATGVTELVCEASATYGSGVQKGTPGAMNGPCFPYQLAPITGAFQSILVTGTPVASMQAGALGGGDEEFETIALPVPVTIFGKPVSTLYVSSNGFVATEPLTDSHFENDSAPSTAEPNGVIAPFWDDQEANTAASGVFWQQFDPNGTPGDGDEYTLISWENWSTYAATSNLNFQIRFVHATGDIEFHYGVMTAATASDADGSAATTWVENAAGTAALAANVNSSSTPGIQSNSGFRFTYAP